MMSYRFAQTILRPYTGQMNVTWKHVPVVSHSIASMGGATSSYSTSTAKSKPLLRSDLVQIIAEEHDMTKAKASRVVGTVLDNIVESLSKDRPVQLSKFGTFSTAKSQARKGRNFATGDLIDIPEKKRIKFKSASELKAKVN